MREVAARTGGRMRLGPGTLYSSIQSLLEAKLIEERDGVTVEIFTRDGQKNMEGSGGERVEFLLCHGR